jgi:hypothetical protein
VEYLLRRFRLLSPHTASRSAVVDLVFPGQVASAAKTPRCIGGAQIDKFPTAAYLYFTQDEYLRHGRLSWHEHHFRMIGPDGTNFIEFCRYSLSMCIVRTAVSAGTS